MIDPGRPVDGHQNFINFLASQVGDHISNEVFPCRSKLDGSDAGKTVLADVVIQECLHLCITDQLFHKVEHLETLFIGNCAEGAIWVAALKHGVKA